MKRILISIKPEWVEKILNGEKTLEIRKSMPKCELPCKVYIYCTKSRNDACIVNQKDTFIYRTINIDCVHLLGNGYIGNGRVVAEFTLNRVEELENTILPTIPTCVYLTKTKRYAGAVEKESCLSQDEIYTYLSGRDGYAWHIDNLIIYDKPKELSEFKVYDKTYNSVGAFGWAFSDEQKYTPLKRPPQSWCYVEEKGEIK